MVTAVQTWDAHWALPVLLDDGTHLRARQYDPATGRFTSPDPTGYAGGDNLYAYAGNNPATWVDRAGTAPTDPLSGRRVESGGPPSAHGPAGRLVPYGTKGTKTSGILDTGTEEIALESGRKGPAASMPDDAPGMTRRMVVRDHVEAHASAVMRQRGLTDADLYINRKPCPGAYGCDAMLPHMLPEGATLRVHVRRNLTDPWTTSVYRGLPDSAWPPPGTPRRW